MGSVARWVDSVDSPVLGRRGKDFVLRIALRLTIPRTNSSYQFRGAVISRSRDRVFRGPITGETRLNEKVAESTYTTVSDHEIEVLESQFPAFSGAAFAAARRSVLASGQSVLQTEGGMVVRVFPDGRREMVKEIEPPTLLKTGTIYIIE